MATNKEVAAALREAANRIENCERELDCDVQLNVYQNETIEQLRQAVSIANPGVEATSSGDTSWVKGSINESVEVVCFYRTGLLGNRVTKQVEVVTEEESDLSLLGIAQGATSERA